MAKDKTTGLTPQQEEFASGLAAGLSNRAAYKRAYPKSERWKESALDPAAARLAVNTKVVARICELRAPARKAHEITVESVTSMLLEARDLAHQEKQASAAVAAVMGIAKLHGLLIDKSERGKPGDFGNLSPKEAQEVKQAVEDELAKRRAKQGQHSATSTTQHREA